MSALEAARTAFGDAGAAFEADPRVRTAYLIARPAGETVEVALALFAPAIAALETEACRAACEALVARVAGAVVAALTPPHWCFALEKDLVAVGELPEGYEAVKVYHTRPRLRVVGGEAP